MGRNAGGGSRSGGGGSAAKKYDTWSGMPDSDYNAKSATASGRKDLHDELLGIAKDRMNSLLQNAPQQHKQKVQDMLNSAYSKMQTLGNSALHTYFAGSYSAKNPNAQFAKYTDDLLKGRL